MSQFLLMWIKWLLKSNLVSISVSLSSLSGSHRGRPNLKYERLNDNASCYIRWYPIHLRYQYNTILHILLHFVLHCFKASTIPSTCSITQTTSNYLNPNMDKTLTIQSSWPHFLQFNLNDNYNCIYFASPSSSLLNG